jgi:hypothetical protein
MKAFPRAAAAGGRKAPRQEIAVGDAVAVQRGLWVIWPLRMTRVSAGNAIEGLDRSWSNA